LHIYQKYVGAKAKFLLSEAIVPRIMIPYRKLVTNILLSQPVNSEDISEEYIMIRIYLIHDNEIYACGSSIK
jgi:hypothetical protein